MEEEVIGVNESEPAEQTTEASEPEVNTEGTESEAEGNTETPEAEQPVDRNAIYADARRRAESEAHRKYGAIDTMFAEKFKDYKNPVTGQPIKSAKDYFEAIAAQEDLANKQMLANKGIDPNLIEKAVNNSPAIKTANLIIAEQRQKEIANYLEKQVEEISKIDPDIKSVGDIEKSERYSEVQRYVRDNRLSVVDAYKLVYADKLNEKKTAAVKQQAINNAKSQQHLVATEGGNGSDNLVNIPEKLLPQWKEWFPNKSSKELREMYNRSLHK